VAIASGGTAGHVHPALAVADAWRALRPGVELTFLGTPDGFAARVAPARFVPVPAAPLVGSGARGKVRALATALHGAGVARRALAASRPRVLLAFGNYASAGAVLGARSLGIPVVLHEANVVPGVANRRLARLAARVLVGFAATGEAFAGGKAVVTGTPVRSELSSIRKTPPDPGRPLRLLVTGGSLGSRFLDAHAPELAARIGCEVRHQAAGPAPVADAYRRLGVSADAVRYLDPMADAYAWADVALTCAGAMTLAELAIVGLPAVVVPLACAALDHQTANAREAARVTGCLSVAESAWDVGVVAEHLGGLARSPEAWSAASAGMRRLAAPDAARRIVDACEAVLEGRSKG
jgi:UDP-N-acetylglucosamine--N-acetylmuramyl-(pentapeptide) pyrophosphoryl-undecaprenol N-acetylglucosamine transferase